MAREMAPDTKRWLEETRADDWHLKLKAALKAAGLSQAAFARMCGCSASNIGIILRREHQWDLCPKYLWAAAQRLMNPEYHKELRRIEVERNESARQRLARDIERNKLHLADEKSYRQIMGDTWVAAHPEVWDRDKKDGRLF